MKVSDCFTACYSTILGSAVLLDAAVKEDRKKEWDRRIAEVKSSIPVEGTKVPDISPPETELELPDGKSRGINIRSGPTSTQSPHTPITESNSPVKSPRQSLDTKVRRALSKPKVRLTWNEHVPLYKNTAPIPRNTRTGQLGLTTGPSIRRVVRVPSDPWLEPKDRTSRMRPESFQLRRDTRMSTKLSVLDAHLKQSIKATSTLRHAPRIQKNYKGSVVDEQSDENYPHREPTKDLHLEKLEGMIARLVARLLITVKTSSTCTATEGHLVQIRKMQARIEALQCRHTQLPEYSWISEEIVREERQGLYSALVRLNKRWGPDSNLELVVAKICYNLLICTAPPDMAMYNLLLEIFTNRKLPQLGQVIVDSFLYESRFRPNHNTLRLMYLHYTEKGDLEGFEAIQKRMNAVGGKDLRVKRRPVWEAQKNFVARWIASKNVMWRGSFIHEVFEPNPAIHDTMMKGFIKLRAIQKSVGLANKQISDGNYISPDTLGEIATACVETGFKGYRTKHFGSPYILVNILEQIMSNKASPEVLYETAGGRKAMYTLRQMAVTSNFYKTWQQWTEVAWEILTRRMGSSYVADALRDYSGGVDSLNDDVDALRKRFIHDESVDDLALTSIPETLEVEISEPFDKTVNVDASEDMEQSFSQFNPQYTPETPEVLMTRIATKLASLELHLIKLQESVVHMSITYVPRNVAVHRFIRYQKQRRSSELSISHNAEGLTKELAVLSRIHTSPKAEYYYRITFEQARSTRNQAVEAIAQYRWRKKFSQLYTHTPSQNAYTRHVAPIASARSLKQKLAGDAFNSIAGAFGSDVNRTTGFQNRASIETLNITRRKSEVRNEQNNVSGGRTKRRSIRVGDPIAMKAEIRRRGAMGRGGKIRREVRMKALESLPASESSGFSKPEIPATVSIPLYAGSIPLMLPTPSSSPTSQAVLESF